MGREACLPCRIRKLRCDVDRAQRGPCSRCVETARERECIVPPRQKRRINRSGRGGQKHTAAATQPHSDRDVSAPGLELEKSTESRGHESLGTPLGSRRAAASAELEDATNNVTPVAVSTLQDGQVLNAEQSAVIEDSPTLTTSCSTLETEDTILQQVCQQIARPYVEGRVGWIEHAQPWATFIEYQNTLQPTGILGELLASYKHPNRMTQVAHIAGSGFRSASVPQSRRELELLGLEENEVAFLTSANVFAVPPKDVCIELFEKFFMFAHPYTPVLDRGVFLSQFCSSDCSSFVLQAVLATAMPYASEGLLLRAGFLTHQCAIQEFNKRAVLLYNFNCEKQQLALLQGALLLSTQWLSHSGDKDYRFWISTATRLAMRMGLHRSHIQDEVDSRFYALLKRIWCVLWVRDVLLVTTGLINERRIPDDCDTVELCEADWVEDIATVPLEMRDCLKPISAAQKQFFVHSSRLARIGRETHRVVFSRKSVHIDHEHVESILAAIRSWKQERPPQLITTAITSWVQDGIWALVLEAWASRMECHIHRAIWRSSMKEEHQSQVSSGLKDSIFNLDAVFRRAVLHGLCRYLPLAMTTSAAVKVALAIELLCQPDVSPGEKSLYQEAIRSGVTYLREVQEIWSTVRALLSLFAWVIARKGLDYPPGLESMAFPHSQRPKHFDAEPSFFDFVSGADGFGDDEIARALLLGDDALLGSRSWNDSFILQS